MATTISKYNIDNGTASDTVMDTITDTLTARITASAIGPSTHLSMDTDYDLGRIALPLPPSMAQEDRFEMEIYARFMRHLRMVPNSRMEIKILSSIQFTADMMDHGDALVAKTLVDLGLRAPRCALPSAYLDFVDKSLQRAAAGYGAATAGARALKEHWDTIGEENFVIVTQSCLSFLPDGAVSRA